MIKTKAVYRLFLAGWIAVGCAITMGCAQVSVPEARTLDVPAPKLADKRQKAVNERPDSVMYLPLGEDILVPEAEVGSMLPVERVGPFELRSESLAGALQLILADYDISLAFETDEGLNRRITVANLHGSLHTVVNRVCSLADLYCSYEEGILVVKDTQTFTVSLPPIGGGGEDTEFLDNVAEGLGAILGEDSEPIVDPTTRTIVYTATQRTADMATRYFQRLRASTAMIVFETYIWEVQLSSGNSTGIDWDQLDTFGKFNASLAVNGAVDSDFTNPVSIGLPTTQNIGATPSDLVQFLSRFGAVKSISQPQITVLSGSEASLRVADTENYVSEITTTLTDTNSTTSVSTDSVDSGFEMTIGSTWDKSTVYANIALLLTNVIDITNFAFSDSDVDAGGTDTVIQLPQTSERELNTNIRVRPGDSILIAGLVRENDNFSSRGPGINTPILPDSRSAELENLELVILMRPRVVVYTGKDDQRYRDYVAQKNKTSIAPALKASAVENYSNTYEAPVQAVQAKPISATPAPVRIEPVAAGPIATGPIAAPVPVVATEPEPIDLFRPPANRPTAPAPAPVAEVPAAMPDMAPVWNAPEAMPTMREVPSARPAQISRYSSGYVSRSSDLGSDGSLPSYPESISTSYDAPSYEVYEAAPIYPSAPTPAPVYQEESASPYESLDYYVPTY